MNRKILRLSPEAINQIAAGEVVENPASIVKELIENSLDANATQISISIEKGGFDLIQVEDNGFGMEPDDALLSLERHATSKIRSPDDLLTLSTMGFRGEALAAISSVSRFEMITSTNTLGTKIVTDGAALLQNVPFARNRGTTISVRSLFHNTPARKKFQKSIGASTAQIVKIVETLALAHPKIAFTLTSNKEKLLSLFPQEPRARIEALLGPFKETFSQDGIFGFLGAPEEAKMQRRGQYVFVNLRPIFSPLIGKAVQKGYGTRLEEGLHPPFVLFLDLKGDAVDVNVHPQKKEVRFSDEGKVFRIIEKAVESAFEPLPSFSSPLHFLEERFSPPIAPFRTEDLPWETTQQTLEILYPVKPLYIQGRHLLLQTETLLLIDLERMHRRILFESLSHPTGASQALLIPLEIAIDEEPDFDALLALGIECRLIGKKRIAIDTLPPHFEPGDFLAFFSNYQKTKRLDTSLVSKKTFSLDSGLFLWKELMKCKEKNVDPQGFPIWKEIRPTDFERILL